MRPDFENYLDQLDPGDTDDPALIRRWMVGIDPVDAELLVSFSDAELAESVREALEQPEGYLRDAAVTFRTWEFRPETVTCPTSLWYGALDRNHPVRNGRWLADRIPGATLTELDGTAHLGALLTRWEAILGFAALTSPRSPRRRSGWCHGIERGRLVEWWLVAGRSMRPRRVPQM